MRVMVMIYFRLCRYFRLFFSFSGSTFDADADRSWPRVGQYSCESNSNSQRFMQVAVNGHTFVYGLCKGRTNGVRVYGIDFKSVWKYLIPVAVACIRILFFIFEHSCFCCVSRDRRHPDRRAKFGIPIGTSHRFVSPGFSAGFESGRAHTAVNHVTIR